MKLFFSFLFILNSLNFYSQDTIRFDASKTFKNYSIANEFKLYTGDQGLSIKDFLSGKSELEESVLEYPIFNLDFSTKTFFLHFVLINETNKDLNFFLEVARPVTNRVELYDVSSNVTLFSGDGIAFKDKCIPTNENIFAISIPRGSETEFVLLSASDGEMLTLPIIFWEQEEFYKDDQNSQFSLGVYYGVFLFVIFIYTTFYFLTKDKIYLIYSFYVLSTGFLQFSLDGFVHQYLFQSGGYFTQHSVLFFSSISIFLILYYSSLTLNFKGKVKKATVFMEWVALLTLFMSLSPGKLYEISYPLINSFALIAVLFIILMAIIVGRDNRKARLFTASLVLVLIGALVFILGNLNFIKPSYITENSLKLGTLFQIVLLSFLMAIRFKNLQKEKEKAQLILLEELSEKANLTEKINAKLEEKVIKRTAKIESQRELLKVKNDEFIASVTYAKRIQSALLSNEKQLKSVFNDSFVFNRPKDIVGGDFYWVARLEPSKKWLNGLLICATADCTGHGVPGAFVSIICNDVIRMANVKGEFNTPGEVLDFVSQEVNEVLNSKFNPSKIRDGMDISLYSIDIETGVMFFSGAKNGLIIIRKKELIILKGDKKAIGFIEDHERFNFTTQSFQLEDGDMIYTCSDGYVDQFGGTKQKKFLSKRLKELLLSVAEEPLQKQQELIETNFDDWKGELEQIDDVLLIGVRYAVKPKLLP